MITEERIRELVNRKFAGTGSFIVEIKLKPVNNITVLVDNEQGITLSECAGLNRFLEKELDRTVEDFSLEISSPGLGQPFKVKEQYRKYTGKKVDVILKDGRKYTGILLGTVESGIKLEETVNKESRIHNFDFNNIKETKTVIPFSK